jgi:hypothetical protein
MDIKKVADMLQIIKDMKSMSNEKKDFLEKHKDIFNQMREMEDRADALKVRGDKLFKEELKDIDMDLEDLMMNADFEMEIKAPTEKEREDLMKNGIEEGNILFKDELTESGSKLSIAVDITSLNTISDVTMAVNHIMSNLEAKGLPIDSRKGRKFREETFQKLMKQRNRYKQQLKDLN